MSKKTALITGILGQDGAYLARIALREGYQVIGAARNLHLPEKKWRLQHLGLAQDIVYQETDLNDQESVNRAIQTHQPELVFNLAAQSSVATSFKLPYETLNSTLMGAARIFEAVRQFAPEARVFQPLSSEARSSSSPYAAAKACAKLIADLWAAVQAGDLKRAMAIQAVITPLKDAVYGGGEPTGIDGECGRAGQCQLEFSSLSPSKIKWVG